MAPRRENTGTVEMPNTEVETRLTRIEERLTNVEGSSYLHDKRHENDSEMLARVLDNLEHHTQNAHGLGSRVRQVGGLSAIAAVVLATLEILRQFFL